MLPDDIPEDPGGMEQRLLPLPRGPADENVVGAMVGFLFILPPLTSLMQLQPRDQTLALSRETTRRQVQTPLPSSAQNC